MKISRLAKYCILQGLQNIFSLHLKTKDITLQSQQNRDKKWRKQSQYTRIQNNNLLLPVSYPAKVWTPCNFSSKTLQMLLKVCIFAVLLSKYQFTKNYTRTAAVYEKRRLLNALSWRFETSQLSGIVKNKATVDVLRGMYSLHIIPSRLSGVKHIGVNISGVGSLRCSFYYTGQCEGLEAWTGEQ